MAGGLRDGLEGVDATSVRVGGRERDFRLIWRLRLIFCPLAHEDLFDIEGLGGFDELGARGEIAVIRVLHELLDGDFGGLIGGGFALAREVEGGDLEAVEEQAGAARVDLVEGDAAEGLGDGDLDGGAVLDEGEGEGGAAGFALGWVPNWDAGVVVEVTKFFVAQADGAAADAAGENVAALEAHGGWCCDGFWVLHGVSPLPG
jgi:hypothetical protein